jgi:AhpC/TSA family
MSTTYAYTTSPAARRSRRLGPGAPVAPRRLPTVGPGGDPFGSVAVPDPSHLVHLQFRRFAGCPVCNVHLRSFARRNDEITAAGVREVVLFHSTADALRPFVADLPFAVVPDPTKRVYAEFGVESSVRSLLDPRGWPTILRAVAVSLRGLLGRRQPAPPLRPAGGRYGLPADILVAPDGRVVAAHYGTRVDDHWSVDDLLALAHTAATG